MRKSQITTRDTVNIDVYMLSWFHFWGNLKNSFHLIEHVQRNILVFQYFWLFLRKSKITAGDALNSRLSIYVPKKVLVKKDPIYKIIVHGQDLISRMKPGRYHSIYIAWSDLNLQLIFMALNMFAEGDLHIYIEDKRNLKSTKPTLEWTF